MLGVINLRKWCPRFLLKGPEDYTLSRNKGRCFWYLISILIMETPGWNSTIYWGQFTTRHKDMTACCDSHIKKIHLQHLSYRPMSENLHCCICLPFCACYSSFLRLAVSCRWSLYYYLVFCYNVESKADNLLLVSVMRDT